MSPHPNRSSTRRGGRIQAIAQPVVIIALLAGLTAYYAFQCTAGTFATLAWRTEYYDLAAEGFRLGQLALPVKPHPVLLAQANPYDPLNLPVRALWMWDAILWNGRYFIYWGPVPALCLLAWKFATDQASKIHDQWLVLAFMLGRLYAGAALIWSVGTRPGRRVPSWACVLGILAFGLAGPTPYVMIRPVIYEASIAAGQCFLFAGLLAAFWAIERRMPSAAVLAGLCWGLALNSRVTWLLVAPLLAAGCALVAAWRGPLVARNIARSWRPACAFGLPVALSIAAAGVYNYARFGSPFDFGVAHQLTGRPFTADARFILPNVYSYLFAEIDWSCRFPFVQVSVNRVLPSYIHWPADYDIGAWTLGERVSGIFVMVPLCYLSIALLCKPLENLWRRGYGLSTARPQPLSRAELALVVCSLACLVSLAPALGGWTASMRYLEDAAGAAILLGVLGGFRMLRARARAVRWPAYAVFALLAFYSSAVGVGLGFSGITDNFPRENPQLYVQLVNSLSVCPSAP